MSRFAEGPKRGRKAEDWQEEEASDIGPQPDPEWPHFFPGDITLLMQPTISHGILGALTKIQDEPGARRRLLDELDKAVSLDELSEWARPLVDESLEEYRQKYEVD